MPKVIPAVFFQKQIDGVKEDAQMPERLELFESQLREVAGGQSRLRAVSGLSGARLAVGGSDGSGGHTTFSGSAGWADVSQGDDCSA
jgi:hypothetical protein